jgi:hypothetical protein
MRSMVTDEAPVPSILPDGTVVLVIGGHPDIHVRHDIVRRFCSDTLFLIDQWERQQRAPRTSNVCRFKKPPGH